MPKEKIVCQKCGKKFEDYLSNRRRYCSKKCSKDVLYKKNHIPWIKGKHHSVATRKKIKSNLPKRFGTNAPCWKGGRIKGGGGYIMINSPEHPNKTKQGYVLEHRLVMEKHIGRYLESKEHVHHKNGDISDNRIENLELISESDHHKLHYRKMQRIKTFSVCEICGRSNVQAATVKICNNCYQKIWRKKRKNQFRLHG